MSRRLLKRGWLLVGCACFATVTGAASCSTSGSSSGSSISGSTLRIYISVPPGTLSPEAQDVLRAERLAFPRPGLRVGKYTVNLVRYAGSELSNTARQAIGDATTIAYLGELAPGDSADTLGITNAENVLQVSPTDTAVELTESTPAIPKTPDKYYEALSANGRTFARLVPTDAVEAAAVVTQMQALGVKRVYVPTDGSEYGRALRSAFVSRAGAAGITVAGSDATVDGVFYAGGSPRGAAGVFDGAVTSNPKVALFAPSALELDSFAGSLSTAAQKQLYVSSPGFTSSTEPAAASQFDSAFKAAYGHAPATQAVFGYAAMQAVIQALRRAGSSAGDRSTVVHDFFQITNFSTAAGAITIDKNGDVAFSGGAPLVFSRVKAGRLVPVKATHG
jgi:branched-chain amino acid transport system substrate-binding protein